MEEYFEGRRVSNRVIALSVIVMIMMMMMMMIIIIIIIIIIISFHWYRGQRAPCVITEYERASFDSRPIHNLKCVSSLQRGPPSLVRAIG